MEAAPGAGLTCYDSVDAAKALALPWPDLYYSPAWGAVELAAGASAWELALWRRRDDASDGAGPAFVAYAYAKRPVLRRGRRGAGTCGRPTATPAVVLAATESDWAAFRAAFVALARERGYVSEFVRFSPLFPHFATAYGAAAAALATRRVATIAADLRAAPTATGAARPSSTGTRRRWTGDASRLYYFDEAYYAALVAELPRGDCYYATATAPDGSLVSAAIFLRHGAALHYHLSGSRAAGYALAGPSAILDAAARLGAALGCATLHLGGASGPATLATFKRAVGDVVLDWTLGTSVLDPGAFDALMAIRAAAVHTDVADLARGRAFFPPTARASTATTSRRRRACRKARRARHVPRSGRGSRDRRCFLGVVARRWPGRA
ncbi:hypothetical protein JL720_4297 [Aureococcus anophagefferens]|nr:hypothetical protein JL720_4297 [Aureococcus anophagefferens]